MSTPPRTSFAAFAQIVRTKTDQGRLSSEEAQHLLFRLQDYVSDVPSEEATKLIVQLSAVVMAAGGRLAGPANNHDPTAASLPVHEDRLLTVAEAAKRLNVTTRWLYSNHHRLPFTKRLSKKALRFSERGLLRWLQRGKPASAQEE